MSTLPEIRDVKPLYNFFPTDWQRVLFRSYGMVPDARLAEILHMNTVQVAEEAARLGLRPRACNPVWEKRGYITLLRDNWELLDYEGLLRLLDCDEQRLAFLLKEDDFLDVKLGGFKPAVEPPVYRPLTREQARLTGEISALVSRMDCRPQVAPFDFFARHVSVPPSPCCQKNGFDRIIYSYFALYGDCLLDGSIESYSDEVLQKLRDCGVTGVWMQGLLTKLVEFPRDPTLSQGFELRQKNLNQLIARCRKYGISVFLYLNEPRCLPNAFFEANPDWRGHSGPQYSALCTGNPQVKEYLYSAVRALVRAVPELGGILTITMSENLTNCVSREPTNCPVCGQRAPEEILSEVNNLMCRAIRDENAGVRLIANLWGWAEHGFPDGTAERALELLDPAVEVMCVSETLLPVEKGGIQNQVIDYSISNVGPSPVSESLLRLAKRLGHRTWAKIQVNNSWECCAVPYLPVFDLVESHIRKLRGTGIDGLMLSWTLGGYPSPALGLAARLSAPTAVDSLDWYRELYGRDWSAVRAAVEQFSRAFTSFPFDLNVLYFAPQNVGCANLWYREPTGQTATMVCYPYDDLETWRGRYPPDVLKELFRQTAEGFAQGLELLPEQGNGATEELRRMAEVCFLHFRSCYLQICWIQSRGSGNEALCQRLLDEEYTLTERLYRIQNEDARIGFEASNHYYYHANTLLEKLWNLQVLKRELCEMRENAE